MFKLTLALILGLSFRLSVLATSVESPKPSEFSSAKDEAPARFDLSHSAWTKIILMFSKPVEKGLAFNFQALKEDPVEFEYYLSKLAQVDSSQFESWTENDQKAFWINAYNAFSLKLIVDNYPIKSIKNVGGLFANPWKKKFIKIQGKSMSLDEIQSEILQKKYKDPKLQFGLSCYCKSGPILRTEAYVGARLQEQLEEQYKTYATDSNTKDFKIQYRNFDWSLRDFKN